MFAPTDEAFNGVGLNPINVVSTPQQIVKNLLLYHTLPGAVTYKDIYDEDTLYTALEVELATSNATLVDSEGSMSSIIERNVTCSNGFLQFIDKVLIPPDLITMLVAFNSKGGPYPGVFDTFLTALELTNRTHDLMGLNGPFTVSIIAVG